MSCARALTLPAAAMDSADVWCCSFNNALPLVFKIQQNTAVSFA